MEPQDIQEIDIIRNETDILLEKNKRLRNRIILLQRNLELQNICQETSHVTEEPEAPTGSEISEEGHAHQKDDSKRHMCISKPYLDDPHRPMEKDSYQLKYMQRVVGEIGFQLEQRILSHIFEDHVRRYGITVADIPQKIKEVAKDSDTGYIDKNKLNEMTKKYEDMLERLKQYGYDITVHPVFTERIINTYGIMKVYPSLESPEMRSLCDKENLKSIVCSTVSSDELDNVLTLLRCLCKLSKSDNKPIFQF